MSCLRHALPSAFDCKYLSRALTHPELLMESMQYRKADELEYVLRPNPTLEP